MRTILLATLAIFALTLPASAASCSSARDKCMKLYAGKRGTQGNNPLSNCVASYDKCLQTGVWSGSKTITGLSKN